MQQYNINEQQQFNFQAIFQLAPLPPVVARTHLQLGVILTKVQAGDQARQHLEQAWYVSQPLPGIDEVKFEAASLLAQAYSQASNPNGAAQVLNSAMELSTTQDYWHCRLALQLASLHTSLQDYASAHIALQQGADYAFMQRAYYTRTLFVLSKSLLFLCERRFQEANPLLQQVISHKKLEVQQLPESVGLTEEHFRFRPTSRTGSPPTRVTLANLLPHSRRSIFRCSTWFCR